MPRAVLLHGGAGRMERLQGERLVRYREGLAEAARAGYEALCRAADPAAAAVEAVVAAVAAMEASGAFNAGLGACLNLDRRIELDAALADGRGARAGAVGAVRRTRSPIRLARAVLERTDHVLLVGEGADRFAALVGLDDGGPPVLAERLEEYEQVRGRLDAAAAEGRLARLALLLKTHPEVVGADTVGAVAADGAGNVAAAVSTGGLWLKLPGRVGDSAIPGAGAHADNGLGAASATGIGEAIIRAALCRRACEGLRGMGDPVRAAAAAVEGLSALAGPETGGLVLLSRDGRPGCAFNTAGMGRAYLADDLPAPLVAVFRDEAFL